MVDWWQQRISMRWMTILDISQHFGFQTWAVMPTRLTGLKGERRRVSNIRPRANLLIFGSGRRTPARIGDTFGYRKRLTYEKVRARQLQHRVIMPLRYADTSELINNHHEIPRRGCSPRNAFHHRWNASLVAIISSSKCKSKEWRNVPPNLNLLLLKQRRENSQTRIARLGPREVGIRVSSGSSKEQRRISWKYDLLAQFARNPRI